jgi:hypothetical protein
LELDFQDCKVLVSNVDSQRSYNGCIAIMVLGEISNKGGASHKFAQTFVLAEQPSGYFVYNDMFRYLKEDIDNDYEDSVDPTTQSGFVNEAHINYVEPVVVEPEPEPAPVHVPPPVKARSPSPVKEIPPPVAPVAQRAPTPQPRAPSPQPPAPAPAQKEPEPESWADSEPQPVETQKAAWAAVQKPTKAEAAPIEPKKATAPAAPAKAAPVPAAAPSPSKPKTWANLAASNPQNWTSEQVSAAKGQVATKAPVNGTQQPPKSTAATTPAPQTQKGGNAKKPVQNAQAASDDATANGEFREVQGRKQNNDRKSKQTSGPNNNRQTTGKRSILLANLDNINNASVCRGDLQPQYLFPFARWYYC